MYLEQWWNPGKTDAEKSDYLSLLLDESIAQTTSDKVSSPFVKILCCLFTRSVGFSANRRKIWVMVE